MPTRPVPQPFRLFFPLAAALGVAGVGPWVLFALGAWPGYPGLLHAFTMSESFLVAPAVGFLGTMIPRRTATSAFSRLEVALLALAIAGVPVLNALNLPRVSQLSFLLALGTLGAFVIPRLRGAKHPLPVPPSFVFMPAGVLLAVTGAVMAALVPDTSPSALAVGRWIAQQGLMLCMVMAIAPFLRPALVSPPSSDEPTGDARRRIIALHVAGAALLASSFPLELWSARAGLLLRGLVVASELTWTGGLFAPTKSPGLHRRLYRVALVLTPLGLLLAGAVPPHRTALLHLTFIGGLTTMIFAVAAHVVMLHTGREQLARSNPRALVVVGTLVIVAALVRATADAAGARFLLALLVAASLWLLAAALWAAFIIPQLVRDLPESD